MIHTRPVGIDTRPGAVEIVAELQGRTIGTVNGLEGEREHFLLHRAAR